MFSFSVYLFTDIIINILMLWKTNVEQVRVIAIFVSQMTFSAIWFKENLIGYYPVVVPLVSVKVSLAESISRNLWVSIIKRSETVYGYMSLHFVLCWERWVKLHLWIITAWLLTYYFYIGAHHACHEDDDHLLQRSYRNISCTWNEK